MKGAARHEKTNSPPQHPPTPPNAGTRLAIETVLDDGSTVADSWSINKSGWICVEIGWSAASGAIAGDGRVRTWIAGQEQASSLVWLQNYVEEVDEFRLGNPDLIDGFSGRVNFDNFVATGGTYIGPLPDPPAPTPLLPQGLSSTNPPTFEWSSVPSGPRASAS